MRQHTLTLVVSALIVGAAFAAAASRNDHTEHTAPAKQHEFDPGSAQSGKAPAWRILWVGGYRQQGVYQAEQEKSRQAAAQKRAISDERKAREEARRQELQQKRQQDDTRRRQERLERDEDARRRREEEAAKRRKLEQERLERERDRKLKQERADHDRKCRGLGLPAGCTIPNPGRSSR